MCAGRFCQKSWEQFGIHAKHFIQATVCVHIRQLMGFLNHKYVRAAGQLLRTQDCNSDTWSIKGKNLSSFKSKHVEAVKHDAEVTLLAECIIRMTLGGFFKHYCQMVSKH